MCLYTNSANVKTAKKKITVYKMLCKSPSGEFISPYRGFKYKKGVIYDSNLKLIATPIPTTYIVENGLHSFKSIRSLKKSYVYSDYYKRAIICKCIIPKGAKYYEGNIGDIVSNALIVKRKLIFGII